MALESQLRRTEQARDGVGAHLDELERRFAPHYVGGILTAAARYSAAKHPVAWAVGTTLAAATTLGLIAWAVFSDED